MSTWKPHNLADHAEGHPSGYDCWGCALGPREVCPGPTTPTTDPNGESQ